MGGSRGGEALSGEGAEALTTEVLRSAPRHLTSRVLRPSWHITDTGTLQTRASYLYKGLSFLLTLMFLVLRRNERRINRVYRCSTASFTVV